MIIQADEEVIYDLIKRAVNEAVDEKISELKLNLIPDADIDENQEMDELFGNPAKYYNQEFERVLS